MPLLSPEPTEPFGGRAERGAGPRCLIERDRAPQAVAARCGPRANRRATTSL